MTALKFPLGRTVSTPAALEALGDRVGQVLARHASGDWGDLDREDREANDRALRDGERLLSRYDVGGASVYVITEHDRSSTTVMLTEEY